MPLERFQLIEVGRCYCGKSGPHRTVTRILAQGLPSTALPYCTHSDDWVSYQRHWPGGTEARSCTASGFRRWAIAEVREEDET